VLNRWWVIGMTVNGRPNGSSLSATAHSRWTQTPNIVSGLEETGPEDPFYKSHAAPQTCELLTHVLMEDSSRDEASGEP
jgi:hypothetical protein